MLLANPMIETGVPALHMLYRMACCGLLRRRLLEEGSHLVHPSRFFCSGCSLRLSLNHLCSLPGNLFWIQPDPFAIWDRQIWAAVDFWLQGAVLRICNLPEVHQIVYPSPSLRLPYKTSRADIESCPACSMMTEDAHFSMMEKSWTQILSKCMQ